MAIDLSALEESVAIRGAPLQLALKDIDEDPDQPRKAFDAESMVGMIASVRFRGVKSPVSVRPHPTQSGRWMLNYGARRYRASLEAGRTTIPAFVDEAHDDYDQVIENLQRSDLTPMELAIFIGKKLAEGEKKKSIANKLGKDASAITHHIALIDPPVCIEDAYSSGRCTSAKILYDLRALYEKHPEAVQAWCSSESEITRKTVGELAEVLSGKPPKVTSRPAVQRDASASSGVCHDIHPNPDDGMAVERSPDVDTGSRTKRLTHSQDQGSHGAEGMDRGDDASSKIESPLLLVEIAGRQAMLLLTRLPSAQGLLRIKYDDDESECEIEAGLCRMIALIDSTS